MTGWEDMYALEAPPSSQGGKVIYWVSDSLDHKKLRPHWDQSFDDNWKAWGDNFITCCQDEEAMGVHIQYLKSFEPKDFKEQLRKVTWKSYLSVWKEQKAGTASKKRAEKNIKSAIRNRVVSVSIIT